MGLLMPLPAALLLPNTAYHTAIARHTAAVLLLPPATLLLCCCCRPPHCCCTRACW